MSSTPQQFAAKMHDLARRGLPDVEREAVGRSALYAKTVIGAVIRQAAGGDSKLSGVGKKGAKVGVRYGVSEGAHPEAWVAASGPLHLLERDTKPREIPRTKVRRLSSGARAVSTKSQRRPIKIGDRWVTGPVKHPGTKGTEPFAKGVKLIEPKIPAIYKRELSKAMAKVFRG